MKRTQIQLEEELFERLRYQAFQEKHSLASVVRRILREHISVFPIKAKKGRFLFSFVASGRSHGLGRGKISEKHDEELSRAFSV